jgi:hypothetical protein
VLQRERKKLQQHMIGKNNCGQTLSKQQLLIQLTKLNIDAIMSAVFMG